jgi:hypothetical protein
MHSRPRVLFSNTPDPTTKIPKEADRNDWSNSGAGPAPAGRGDGLAEVADGRDLVALDRTIRPEYDPEERCSDFLVVNDSSKPSRDPAAPLASAGA